MKEVKEFADKFKELLKKLYKSSRISNDFEGYNKIIQDYNNMLINKMGILELEFEDFNNNVLENIKYYKKFIELVDDYEETLITLNANFNIKKGELLLKYVHILDEEQHNPNRHRILNNKKLPGNYNKYEANLYIINKIKEFIINHGIELNLNTNHNSIINNYKFEKILEHLNNLLNKIPKDKLKYLLDLEKYKDDEDVKKIKNLIEILNNNGIEIKFNNNIESFNLEEINNQINDIINDKVSNKLKELGVIINVISTENLQYINLFNLPNSVKIYLILILTRINDSENKDDINELIAIIKKNLEKHNLSINIEKDISKEKHIKFEDVENSLFNLYAITVSN